MTSGCKWVGGGGRGWEGAECMCVTGTVGAAKGSACPGLAHQRATLSLRSSRTGKGEMTWTGSLSRGERGGGFSGLTAPQRRTSPMSTTCGLAPRGSMLLLRALLWDRTGYSVQLVCSSRSVIKVSDLG